MDKKYELVLELANKAATCTKCGKIHEYYPINPNNLKGLWTWADPEDGHSYAQENPSAAEWLFKEAANMKENDVRE